MVFAKDHLGTHNCTDFLFTLFVSDFYCRLSYGDLRIYTPEPWDSQDQKEIALWDGA